MTAFLVSAVVVNLADLDVLQGVTGLFHKVFEILPCRVSDPV